MILNKLLRDAILENKDLNIIEFLIQKGASIHQLDNHDNLLHLVLRYHIKNYNLILFLIENNIDIHSLDNFNKTSLDYILDSNISNYPYQKIFNLLEKKGLFIDSYIKSKFKSKELQKENYLLHLGC